MKPIAELVSSNVASMNERKDDSVRLDPLAGHLVDQIFVKIALICRGFDSFYADRNRLNAEKTQWVLAFTKLGIRNKSQIEGSLSKLELYRYPNPPQLGEFLEWRHLAPQDSGLPTIEKAYQLSLLINQQFSDFKPDCQKSYTVIKHAISQIGSTTYREMTADASRKVFEHNYSIACKQFLSGELKEIPKAIAPKTDNHPEDFKRSDEARQRAMEAMRNMGILKRPGNA